MVFHGLPATLLRRQTIVIDLIDHMAGVRGTRALVLVSDLVIVGLLLMLSWAMVAPALAALDYGDRKLELGLPIIYVWGGAILGMAGAVLAAVLVTARRAPAAAPIRIEGR